MRTLKQFEIECLQHNYPIMRQDVLDFIVSSIADKSSILEIGSCVGYSAIYLASHKQVSIDSIERDMERHLVAKEHVVEYKLTAHINMIYDDALSFEPNKCYDYLIFDAAKGQNEAFLNRFLPFLKTNGKIFIDNVDFHGYKENIDHLIGRKNLKSMMKKLSEFEKNLSQRDDVAAQYFPLGDGLLVLTKL